MPMQFQKLFFIFVSGLLLTMGSCSSNSNNDNSATNVFGDDTPSSNSTPVGPANPNTTLSIVLGLARNQEGLSNRVEELHTPGATHYRNFKNIGDIASEFGATQNIQQKLLIYMNAQDVSLTIDATGAFASGEASVSQLNQIFSTQLYEYTIPGVGNFIAPASNRPPSLPKNLIGVVTEVLGLNTEPSTWDNLQPNPNPPTPRPSNQVNTPGSPTISGTPSGCSEALAKNGFTPNQFLTAFGVDALHQAGFEGQGIYMALVEFNAFDQESLDTFKSCYNIETSYTPQVVQVGKHVPEKNSGEPFLDNEVLSIVAPKLSGLYVFQTVPKSYADWVKLYAAPLDPKKTDDHPINVLSSSLGNCELVWTSTFINLMEHVFMTASANGMHVFTSAGDSGSSNCYHDNGVTTTKSAGYPATSKYVTSVGGTDLLLNTDNSISGEGVWNDLDFPAPYNTGTGAGGGGPSIYNTAPSWQSITNQGTNMRTTPDVAFFAAPRPGYTIYTSLQGWYNDGGTSAATPFLAGSTALLLQMANSQSKVLDISPVWIYNLAGDSATYNSAFQDIVDGNNDLFNVGCCSAEVGYDQASGWGSMNITAAAQALGLQ